MRELKQTWHDLLLGFRVALDFRKMGLGFGFLALMAILFLLGAWALLEDSAAHLQDRFETEFAAKKAWYHEQNPDEAPIEEGNIETLRLSTWLTLPSTYEGEGVLSLLSNRKRDKLFSLWAFTLADLGCADDEGILGTTEARGLTLVRFLVFLVAFLIGWFFTVTWFGAIARLAAVEIARDERPSLGEALQFARKKRRSLFWAPLGPFIFIVLLYLLIALWGVFNTIPWVGPILGVLAVPLVLFGGFLMTMLAIGGVFGNPLMIPALAAEGSDSFDAISRSFSYVFSRPWHYAWYVIVTLVHGFFSIAFVFMVTILTLFFASIPGRWAFGEAWQNFLGYVGQLPRWGMEQIGWNADVCSGLHWIHKDVFGGKFVDAWNAAHGVSEGGLPFSAVGDVPMQIFTILGGFFIYLMIGLMTAFIISYWLTQWTMIYFLLRHQVDGTDTSEIYYEDGEDPWAPLPADTNADSEGEAAAAKETAPAASEESTEGEKPEA